MFLALNMVYEKANSVQTATVEAPNWLHKYIIGRKGVQIRKITQDLPKVIILFSRLVSLYTVFLN